MKIEYIRSLKKKYKTFYYNHIRKSIHTFCDVYSECDKGADRKFLFPAFVECAVNNTEIPKRDLVVLVSDVLNQLVRKRVIFIPDEDGIVLKSGYSYYEILPHENLVQHDKVINKQISLFAK